MKIPPFLFLAFVLALVRPAGAQISVTVSSEQKDFLPGEALVLKVGIVNQSGQTLNFGADQSWLTFEVENTDGTPVRQLQNVPGTEPFDLLSSQQAVRRVDLTPYYDLHSLGRYRITAVLHIKAWGQDIPSKPFEISIIPGGKVWEQSFGVPTTPGQAPEVRRYALNKANYLRYELRLYASISSDDGNQIYGVCNLGAMVGFGDPDARIDATGNLHVLWQTGASLFAYKKISPDGKVLQAELYDYVKARPRLGLDDQGGVLVLGGVRRLSPGENTDIKSPAELAVPRGK
jgi:hypothetical protein